MALTLQDVAAKVAKRFKLDEEEVRDTIFGTELRSMGTPSTDVGDGLLSVGDLKSALCEQEDTDSAVPILLRFALGEFHYGQRATKLLPGQRKRPRTEAPDPPGAPEPGATDARVLQAFDVLAAESQLTHLHQAAGWSDLDDAQVWRDYVRDVMDGKLRDGDRLFEAGCGVLAFLQEAKALRSNITIGGVDGAPRTIALVQKELAPQWAENFTVGLLPQALHGIPDGAWDVVVCNSVFQYFATDDQAEEAVRGMLRVARRWVIIADICDAVHERNTHSRQQGTGWAADLPEYKCYRREWWDRFSQPHLVSLRHVGTVGYVRRKERYVVYIEKDAP